MQNGNDQGTMEHTTLTWGVSPAGGHSLRPLHTQDTFSQLTRSFEATLVGKVWAAITAITVAYFITVYLTPMLGLIESPVISGRPSIETVLCGITIICSIVASLSYLASPSVRVEETSQTLLVHVGSHVVGVRCLEVVSISPSSSSDGNSADHNISVLQALRAGMNSGVNVCFEVGVRSRHPFIRFFISYIGSSVEEINGTLHREAARIEAVLISSLQNVQIVQLEEEALRNALLALTTITIPAANPNELWVSAVPAMYYVIRGRPRVSTGFGKQIDAFLSSMLRQGIDGALSCIFSPAAPSRNKYRLEQEWRQIRHREKKREDSLKDQISKEHLLREFSALRDSKGWFLVSVFARVVAPPHSGETEERFLAIVRSIWGGNDSYQIKPLKPNTRSLLKVLLRRHLGADRMHVSSLSAYVGTPVQQIPEISSSVSPALPVPPKHLTDNEIFIGWSVYKDQPFNRVGLKIEWFREHIAVLGATGMGKTTLVRHIMQELTRKTDVPWWIFDVKGSEYWSLQDESDDILILHPGADPNLRISFIDGEAEDVRTAAHATFAILRDILRERSSSAELSPSMERLLLEALEETTSMDNCSVTSLIHAIEKRRSDHAKSLTVDALLNRLEILRREPLATIFSDDMDPIRISSLTVSYTHLTLPTKA